MAIKANTTLNPKYRKDQCYGTGDLRLGTYINVLGRDFFLHDADTFTKAWYKDNMGYGDEELTPVDIKVNKGLRKGLRKQRRIESPIAVRIARGVDRFKPGAWHQQRGRARVWGAACSRVLPAVCAAAQEPILPKPRGAVPPYNGYGTLEDSLQNCLSLVPKPPKRDLHKLMNKDKIILRFVVKMVETDTHKHSVTDLARRFILSYFMMDDSVLIFEPPLRNSGES